MLAQVISADRVTGPRDIVVAALQPWLAGAQSPLGLMTGRPGLVLPAMPVGLLAILAGVAAVLTLVASVAPGHPHHSGRGSRVGI